MAVTNYPAYYDTAIITAVKKLIVQIPGFTHKHYTRMERPSRDKHSSLLLKFVNNGCKKFNNNLSMDKLSV